MVRQAIEALQELCLTVVLPDRKLKYLEQQPVDALPEGKEGKKQLLMWCVEDAVKRRYNMLVTALEECTRDNLEFLKEKATKVRTSSSCHCPVLSCPHALRSKESLTTSRLPSPYAAAWQGEAQIIYPFA